MFSNNFINLPNLHTLRHLLEYAKQYESLVNISVSLKEIVYQLYKNQAIYTVSLPTLKD